MAKPARRTGLLYLALLVLASTLALSVASAQPMEMPEFKYYVWGHVRSPGAKALGPSPDLLELISSAGGPADGANLKKVELVRAFSQERVRVNVDEVLRKGELIPLSPGDIVIVPRSGWRVFRDNFWLVSGTASVINLGLLVYTLVR